VFAARVRDKVGVKDGVWYGIWGRVWDGSLGVWLYRLGAFLAQW